MNEIHVNDVRQAINHFLSEQLQKKLLPEEKKLAAERESLNEDGISKSEAKIQSFREKYQFTTWLTEDAKRMASSLKFGTHISKGVHPDSKGDAITFKPIKKLPDGIYGSQALQQNYIDASGNAADLPVAGFFAITVKTEPETNLRDLLLEDHPSLNKAFADDEDTSNELKQIFINALNNPLPSPKSDTRNKQILWPNNIDHKDDYICLVPLHPSALVHELYKNLNSARFSDENKKAKDNRFKVKEANSPYISIRDIAVIKIGGSNPQGVSLLNSRQGGRNYLLPSIPPPPLTRSDISKSKNKRSFFNSTLQYNCKDALKIIFRVVLIDINNVTTRESRKKAFNDILQLIIATASETQQNAQPGWSRGHKLHRHEKLWLDPRRAELPDEEEFQTEREQEDWLTTLEKQFADWIINIFKKELKSRKKEFDISEFNESKKEMRTAVKASLRKGEEVFQ